MSAARWEVVRTDAEQPWHLRLVGGNGEIVLTSESYAEQDAALDGIRLATRAPSGFHLVDTRTDAPT